MVILKLASQMQDVNNLQKYHSNGNDEFSEYSNDDANDNRNDDGNDDGNDDRNDNGNDDGNDDEFFDVFEDYSHPAFDLPEISKLLDLREF